MQTQYSVLGCKIDFYFHDCILTIEVDELGHCNRNIDYEIQRQKAIEKELDCMFITINPDEIFFNTFKAINEVHKHSKKSTKKFSTDKISKKD